MTRPLLVKILHGDDILDSSKARALEGGTALQSALLVDCSIWIPGASPGTTTCIFRTVS
jgi:hypothetical protein